MPRIRAAEWLGPEGAEMSYPSSSSHQRTDSLQGAEAQVGTQAEDTSAEFASGVASSEIERGQSGPIALEVGSTSHAQLSAGRPPVAAGAAEAALAHLAPEAQPQRPFPLLSSATWGSFTLNLPPDLIPHVINVNLPLSGSNAARVEQEYNIIATFAEGMWHRKDDAETYVNTSWTGWCAICDWRLLTRSQWNASRLNS